MCPSLDCDVYVDDSRVPTIKRDDWLTMDSKELLYRIYGRSRCMNFNEKQNNIVDLLADNLTIVKDEFGTPLARIALFFDDADIVDKMHSLTKGVITIGGFNAGSIRGLIGIVKGNSINASRNYGMPIASGDQLSQWATNQAELLSKSFLDEKTKADCAQIVCQLGGDTGNLKCFESKDGYLSCSELISYIQKNA